MLKINLLNAFEAPLDPATAEDYLYVVGAALVFSQALFWGAMGLAYLTQ